MRVKKVEVVEKMAIVPVYTGLVKYVKPTLQAYYPMVCYPVFYSYAYRYPAIVHHYPTYPAVPYEIDEYNCPIVEYDHKLINAINNPGSFWIWPPGR
jgi:hypothetical protein